jgi:hypothetical protein
MTVGAMLAVKFGLTVDDSIDTVHPVPAFSEALKRACQAFRCATTTTIAASNRRRTSAENQTSTQYIIFILVGEWGLQ